MTPIMVVRIDGYHVYAENPVGEVHAYTYSDLIEKENAGPYFEHIANLERAVNA